MKYFIDADGCKVGLYHCARSGLGEYIRGWDAKGNEHLIYKGDKEKHAMEANGMLVIDLSDTEFSETLFRSFRIGRPEGNSEYLFVAEVAII